MQKKFTGFLIATLVFNVAILCTVYLIELFSQEVSFIWSWLLFVIVALGVGTLIANVAYKVKLKPQVGVFAFFWSIVFAVLFRFYYHDYSTLSNARIAQSLDVNAALKAKNKYDYFSFKGYTIDAQKIGYQLVKDSLVDKSDPKKGSFHYYVAPLVATNTSQSLPNVFVGKHYVGIEPNYKEIFQKRLKRKTTFYREYPSSYTFAGAVKTLNPSIKKPQNYLLLQPALSPYEQQKSSWKHLLVLLVGGNVFWALAVLIIQAVGRKKEEAQVA
ncbi:hypothetical protein [Microscilla marina]|uniref:Uncharacterized protein n=1 Tax=Microscilla marina ATCC 23134 TaxID=313606 RepID=A1ZIC2_MICM2|nr:hypothetical protein [Microscilla marina]EAY29790.1 hypothetical protein M23134_05662 [Microscilla marina ATCC 23134]